MARAIAICNCKKCGNEFKKIKYDCRNRSDADSWEEWASGHYTICPDCWKAEKEEEEQAKLQKEIASGKKKVIRVHYSVYKNEYSNCKTVKDSYDKATKTIEVIIKAESVEEKAETKAETKAEAVEEKAEVKAEAVKKEAKAEAAETTEIEKVDAESSKVFGVAASTHVYIYIVTADNIVLKYTMSRSQKKDENSLKIQKFSYDAVHAEFDNSKQYVNAEKTAVLNSLRDAEMQFRKRYEVIVESNVETKK